MCVRAVWTHPVWGLSTKTLVSLDYLWITTLLGGSVCVYYLSAPLTEPDRLQLRLHPPYSLPPPVFSLHPTRRHPLLLRCWDAMLRCWLITRVALGGDEGRSPSGSDSCLRCTANCRGALPSVCDKSRCYWQKWCHNTSLSTSITVDPGKEKWLYYFSCSSITSTLPLHASVTLLLLFDNAVNTVLQ